MQCSSKLLQHFVAIKTTASKSIFDTSQITMHFIDDGTLESSNYVALMKALKLVVHNDSSVSLCQGLPGICPANKRLLAYFIEVLDTEDVSEVIYTISMHYVCICAYIHI